MPFSPVSSGGGLTKLFDSTLAAPAASIDSGAGGFATSFDDLYIDILARTAEAAAFSTLQIILNNDGGANYDYAIIRNHAAAASAPTVQGDTSFGLIAAGANAAASYAAVIRISFLGYGQTTFFKSAEATNALATSAAANAEASTWALDYRATTAISRVKIQVSGGSNLATGTRLLIRAS